MFDLGRQILMRDQWLVSSDVLCGSDYHVPSKYKYWRWHEVVLVIEFASNERFTTSYQRTILSETTPPYHHLLCCILLLLHCLHVPESLSTPTDLDPLPLPLLILLHPWWSSLLLLSREFGHFRGEFPQILKNSFWEWVNQHGFTHYYSKITQK